MKTITINTIYEGKRLLPLGRQGENEALQIVFDVSRLIADYGEGTAVLVAQRSQDVAPYTIVTTQSDKTVIWTISSTDTLYQGVGKANLMWNVNNTIAKTIDFDTYVFPSISGIVTVPDALQSWYNEMIEYINSVAVDDSKIEDIVLEYLEEHPIEAPVTSVNSKTGAVVLTSADVGALSESELDTAINSALAQAKASGDFDGADGQDLIHQGETVTSSGVVSKELSPNVFCLFSDTQTGISDLTLTLASGNFYDEYMCAFTTSASGCNLSLPNTVSYLDTAITLEANTYYELSIVNNKAVIA